LFVGSCVWQEQEASFLPKETTVAETPNLASNLEPHDYQADTLAGCYCLGYMQRTVILDWPREHQTV